MKILKIFFCCFLMTMLFFVKSKAETKYDNPYPNIFSDDEISAAVEYGKRENKFHYITRVYLERDGKQTLIPDNTYRWFTKPGDRYMLYAAIVSQANVFQASGTFGWNSNFTLYTVKGNEDRILKKGSVVDQKIEITNVNFTGDQQIENKDGVLKIKFNEVEKPYFLYAEFQIPTDVDLSGSLFVGGKFSSSNQGVNSASTSITFYSLATYTHTKFHFVDDFAYRDLKQINLSDEISERSLNDGPDSNKAFEILDLNDLKTIETSSAFARGFGKIETPFLKPDSESANVTRRNTPEFFFEPSISGIEENGSIFSEKEKPSLDELLKQEFKGYVYIGNDIDKSGNNNLSLPGIVNGKYAVTKHYYLTYRPIPKVLKITKKDKRDLKPLKDSVFELYFLNGNNKILIKNDIKTDSNGEFISSKKIEYNDLKEIVKDSNNIDLEKNIYFKDDDFYLMPGKYLLKEIEAPKSYKTLENPVEFELEILDDEQNLVYNLEVLNEKEEINIIPNKVPNKIEKSNSLPETGSNGIDKFIINLFAIGLTSIVFYKKEND